MKKTYNRLIGCTRYLDDQGEPHNENGPAMIYDNGTLKWYIHGHLHRFDGPATKWNDGSYNWHINGFQMHSGFYNWLEEMEIDPLKPTEYEAILIAMTWGSYGSNHPKFG